MRHTTTKRELGLTGTGWRCKDGFKAPWWTSFIVIWLGSAAMAAGSLGVLQAQQSDEAAYHVGAIPRNAARSPLLQRIPGANCAPVIAVRQLRGSQMYCLALAGSVREL